MSQQKVKKAIKTWEKRGEMTNRPIEKKQTVENMFNMCGLRQIKSICTQDFLLT